VCSLPQELTNTPIRSPGERSTPGQSVTSRLAVGRLEIPSVRVQRGAAADRWRWIVRELMPRRRAARD